MVAGLPIRSMKVSLLYNGIVKAKPSLNLERVNETNQHFFPFVGDDNVPDAASGGPVGVIEWLRIG